MEERAQYNVDTSLVENLRKTVDNPATPSFSNWFNQEATRQEFKWALERMRQLGDSETLRFIMLYAFNAGSSLPGAVGTEPAVAAGSQGFDSPVSLGTAAGSTLPELWVCNACDHVGDPEEWDRDTRPATYRDPAEHHDTCPHCGARNENEEFTFEWYFTELKRKEPKGEPMNSTQTRYVVEALNGE